MSSQHNHNYRPFLDYNTSLKHYLDADNTQRCPFPIDVTGEEL